MKRSVERKRVWWSFLLVLVLGGALGGCRRGPCDDGLVEGERVRITVLSQTGGSSSCQDQVPSLAVGDSFTLVAGPAVMNTVGYGDGESGICTNHGARAEAPPFAADALTSCTTDDQHQLGLMCVGTKPAGCGLSVAAVVNSAIPAGAAAVDHGTFLLTWINDCEVGSCPQLYDVRIERLDAVPGG